MTRKPKKPGPDPEILKIEGDPEEALDRLLGKGQPPTDERPKKKPGKAKGKRDDE